MADLAFREGQPAGLRLRIHLVVGAGMAVLDIPTKHSFEKKQTPSMSILCSQNRYTSGGWIMTTDDQVVDVSQDWFQACSVQERFMRGSAGDHCNVDYSASCRQLRALGGDCYDFSSFSDGRLAMLVGDASGKGVAAALLMANIQASLRTASVFTGDNLPALLRIVNLQVCASSLDSRYATLFCGVLDRGARTLRYVNAGHNSPLVLHRDGSLDWLEPTGAPVGLFPDAIWHEGVIQLNPGDLVLVYTDGVTEALSPSGEEWGTGGLLQAAKTRSAQPADELVRSILESMDKFSQGVQTDDATVAALRVH
ncbi:MAG: PP2C family protein-serine/threonine phosphatase [Terracidiphilus sp.]